VAYKLLLPPLPLLFPLPLLLLLLRVLWHVLRACLAVAAPLQLQMPLTQP
jgi:hypothetical protein